MNSIFIPCWTFNLFIRFEHERREIRHERQKTTLKEQLYSAKIITVGQQTNYKKGAVYA